MRVIITIGGYGFGHDWTLEAFDKQYYLGQDVKFCSRVLGLTPRDLIAHLGSPNIEQPRVNTKLAKFICKELGINKQTNINPWELCAQ